MDRAASRKFPKCLLLHANAVLHGEQLRDELIIDDRALARSRSMTMTLPRSYRRIDIQATATRAATFAPLTHPAIIRSGRGGSTGSIDNGAQTFFHAQMALAAARCRHCHRSGRERRSAVGRAVLPRAHHHLSGREPARRRERPGGAADLAPSRQSYPRQAADDRAEPAGRRARARQPHLRQRGEGRDGHRRLSSEARRNSPSRASRMRVSTHKK